MRGGFWANEIGVPLTLGHSFFTCPPLTSLSTWMSNKKNPFIGLGPIIHQGGKEGEGGEREGGGKGGGGGGIMS
jgi:hypothetical protein